MLNRKSGILILIGVVIVCLLGFILIFSKKNHSLSACVQKKEAVSKLIDEVWSKGNLGVVDQLIAPQYTIRHDPGDKWDGQTLDLNTYKERVNMSRQAFPNQKFYINDLICEGNKVAVSWHFLGTLKGNIPGVAATGMPVNVSGLTIYYFSKKKIIGHWQIVDRLGLMEHMRGKK